MKRVARREDRGQQLGGQVSVEGDAGLGHVPETRVLFVVYVVAQELELRLLSGILQASRQIEFQIVNEARQVFLFEQDGARYRMREIDAPSGARDIVFIPPSVMTALVTEWGPCWTEAEMCTLVKVSATGWEPYLILKQLFR